MHSPHRVASSAISRDEHLLHVWSPPIGSMALQHIPHTGAVDGSSEGSSQKGQLEGKHAPRAALHMRLSNVCIVDHNPAMRPSLCNFHDYSFA